MQSLPQVIWPTEQGEYKVIQLERRADSVPYLRFTQQPDNLKEFHQELLKQFGVESGQECIQDEKTSRFHLPSASPYFLIGAGKCMMDLEGKTIYFYGSSHDYKMKINHDHLQRLSPELPSGYRLEIL